MELDIRAWQLSLQTARGWANADCCRTFSSYWWNLIWNKTWSKLLTIHSRVSSRKRFFRLISSELPRFPNPNKWNLKWQFEWTQAVWTSKQKNCELARPRQRKTWIQLSWRCQLNEIAIFHTIGAIRMYTLVGVRSLKTFASAHTF